MKSYFKSVVDKSSFTFVFDTNSLQDTRRAFEAARETGGKLSIYTVAKAPGPWDKLPLVGHRSRAEILREMQSNTDPDEAVRLEEELESLSFRYTSVGRDHSVTA